MTLDEARYVVAQGLRKFPKLVGEVRVEDGEPVAQFHQGTSTVKLVYDDDCGAWLLQTLSSVGYHGSLLGPRGKFNVASAIDKLPSAFEATGQTVKGVREVEHDRSPRRGFESQVSALAVIGAETSTHVPGLQVAILGDGMLHIPVQVGELIIRSDSDGDYTSLVKQDGKQELVDIGGVSSRDTREISWWIATTALTLLPDLRPDIPPYTAHGIARRASGIARAQTFINELERLLPDASFDYSEHDETIEIDAPRMAATIATGGDGRLFVEILDKSGDSYPLPAGETRAVELCIDVASDASTDVLATAVQHAIRNPFGNGALPSSGSIVKSTLFGHTADEWNARAGSRQNNSNPFDAYDPWDTPPSNEVRNLGDLEL